MSASVDFAKSTKSERTGRVNVAREATREFTDEEELSIGRIVAATATHPRPEDRIATVKPLVKSDRGEVLADRWETWTRQKS